MVEIKSSLISRFMNQPRFIGSSTPLDKEIKYILKRYSNGDILFKQLAEPIWVKRGGFEEVRHVSWTRFDMFKKDKTFIELFPNWKPETTPHPRFYLDHDEQMIVDKDGRILEDGSKILDDGQTAFDRAVIKKAKNRDRANRKTITSIFDILHGRTFDWFLTITFDDTKINRQDPVLCSQKLRNALRNLKSRKYNRLEYFGVWEWHKDEKSIHYHMLMSGIDPAEFSPAIDTRKTYLKDGIETKNNFFNKQIVKNKKPVYNLNLLKYGFTTATRIENNDATIAYITKYITKQFHDKYSPYNDGCHRYINSVSLKKPEKLSMDDKQLYALLGRENSWLDKDTHGLDFTDAIVIQELSEDKNGIYMFAKNKTAS